MGFFKGFWSAKNRAKNQKDGLEAHFGPKSAQKPLKSSFLKIYTALSNEKRLADSILNDF